MMNPNYSKLHYGTAKLISKKKEIVIKLDDGHELPYWGKRKLKNGQRVRVRVQFSIMAGDVYYAK